VDPDPLASIEQALIDLRGGDKGVSSSVQDRFSQVGGLVVDTRRHRVLVDDQPVALTPTEFDILTYLMGHFDRIVSGREIVYHLRGYEISNQEAQEFLSSHIYRLRQKIEADPGNPRYIVTIRGQGYCMPTKPGLLPST
jgi:DNA-binding response OmpR family regulator